jgi:hypothetical protein
MSLPHVIIRTHIPFLKDSCLNKESTLIEGLPDHPIRFNTPNVLRTFLMIEIELAIQMNEKPTD